MITMKFKQLTVNFVRNISTAFVPQHNPVAQKDVKNLLDFISQHNNILVLTGAGISTESGIPDYRSENVGLYARTNHKPIQYLEFLKSSYVRKRYWARNYVGWFKFSQCQPNAVHYAVRELEEMNKISAIVTQNVDNLHFKAGSQNVIELHGTSYRVMCLSCPKTISRFDFQQILFQRNPNMPETVTMIRPDGDVQISEDVVQDFDVPSCENCGGILKPDIIFFGDNVPRQRVELVNDKINASDSVVVFGSSLTVFSSYRIILLARDLNIPVTIVNIGPTRADPIVQMKIHAKCGEILPKVCDLLRAA